MFNLLDSGIVNFCCISSAADAAVLLVAEPGVGRTKNLGDLNSPTTSAVTDDAGSRHGCGVTTYTFSFVIGEMSTFKCCHSSLGLRLLLLADDGGVLRRASGALVRNNEFPSTGCTRSCTLSSK